MKKILHYQKNLGLKEMQNLTLSIFFILTHLIPDSCNEKKKDYQISIKFDFFARRLLIKYNFSKN